MLINDLNFEAILQELISLAIDNREIFCSKPQSAPKNISQPSTSGASPTVMPVMTVVTSTSLPQTMAQPTSSTISSGSTSLPVNPGRGPPQTRHQAVVSQAARFKVNRPITSQAVVQLLDELDKVTEELQCKESIEEANLMEKVHEIVKEFQESPQ